MTVITRAAKLRTRKPARKPRIPANRISNDFGNDILNWPVRKTYVIPYKIKKVPPPETANARALLHGISPASGIMFKITGERKMAT